MFGVTEHSEAASVFDRYHIVAGSDQVETIRKLATLPKENPSEEETRTIPAQSGLVEPTPLRTSLYGKQRQECPQQARIGTRFSAG